MNIGSVDLGALKLLAVKVRGLKKSLPPDPAPLESVSWIQEHPGSNHSQSLMAGNFAAL